MTIIIKNGLVYDGAENAPAKGDIFIQNGRIVRVGRFPKKNADLEIDGRGMVITPGLFDINFKAKGSAGILANPHQESDLLKGITTVMGGGGGLSLAPILKHSLELTREWGFAPSVNVHWRSTAELLATLKKRGVGVNFGTLVGYSVIRRFFTGRLERDLTVRETESARLIVSQCLKEGAFGVSMDLTPPYAKGTPTREIMAVAEEVAKKKKILAIRARSAGEDLVPAIREILEVSKATGANIEINYLQPLKNIAETYRAVLDLIEKKAGQSRINFDVFPHPVTVTPIHSYLPEWLVTGSMKETLDSLREKSVKERVLKHIQKMKLDDVAIAEVPHHLKFLENKTLADFAKNHGLSKTLALFRLMLLTGLNANLLSSSVDKRTFEEFLTNRHSLVSASFSHFTGKYSSGGDLFAWADRSGKMAVEKAVAKMTGLAAVKYGVEKRGFIKEGYFADIALWENWKTKTVIINGALAVKDGIALKNMAGSVLISK